MYVEALVASLLKMLRDLLASGPSSHEKHLEMFFKICHMGFWRLDLATCSRLVLVAKNTFCTNWVKSKTVFKNYATLFWRLTLTGQSSRETLVVSLTRSSRNSLASQAPSREKDLEKFQFSGFLAFSQLTLTTSSRVEALVASLLKMICNSFRNLLVSEPSSCEKHKQIFQNLSHRILAT